MSRAPNDGSISLGTVLLGAGRSARMGKPKLLLPWGETSILGHLLAQWRRLGAQHIAVVCASGDLNMQGELERLRFPLANCVLNPAPERGMFSSLQCAAQWPQWHGGLTHWAVVLGDQPHLRDNTLRRLLDWTAQHPEQICQPARAGHGRHPVLLPKKIFTELARSEAAHLKEFLAGREPALCELDDPGLEFDIDRPEDYQQAWKWWSEQNESGQANRD